MNHNQGDLNIYDGFNDESWILSYYFHCVQS